MYLLEIDSPTSYNDLRSHRKINELKKESGTVNDDVNKYGNEKKSVKMEN